MTRVPRVLAARPAPAVPVSAHADRRTSWIRGRLRCVSWPGVAGALRRGWRAGWLAACLCLLSWPALAAPPYEVEVRSRVLLGRERPALIVHAREEIRRLEVRLRRDGRAAGTLRVATLRAGETREFPLDAPEGTSSWVAEVRHAGSREPDVLTFEVVVARPIEIRIGPGDVDLVRGEVSFIASEAVARVRVEVFRPDGSSLGTRDEAVSVPAGRPVRVGFDPPREPVGRLVVTAYDANGFYNGVEATPFFIEVPHEEVLFEFDRADIRSSEEPKMERTLAKVRDAIARLSSTFAARLYVAGYTDTVGDRDYNRVLSRRRAEAIARWFRAHGLAIGICWQGFGEEAPAVPTSDETPEPRNRRTLHVLANQTPPVSRAFPAADWACLP